MVPASALLSKRHCRSLVSSSFIRRASVASTSPRSGDKGARTPLRLRYFRVALGVSADGVCKIRSAGKLAGFRPSPMTLSERAEAEGNRTCWSRAAQWFNCSCHAENSEGGRGEIQERSAEALVIEAEQCRRV